MAAVKTIPQWYSFVCKNGKSHGHKAGSGVPRFYNEEYKALIKGVPSERVKEILPGKTYSAEKLKALKAEFDAVRPSCGPHTVVDSIEHSGGRVCRRCSEYLANSGDVGKHWLKCKPGAKDEDKRQIAE
jgi:hypothetical protein